MWKGNTPALNGMEDRKKRRRRKKKRLKQGGGGGDMQISYPGVLTKFFRSLEKTGSLGTFCTFQTWVLKKGVVFTIDVILATWCHSTANPMIIRLRVLNPNSRGQTKGDQIRSGCLTLAFSGAQKRAE